MDWRNWNLHGSGKRQDAKDLRIDIEEAAQKQADAYEQKRYDGAVEPFRAAHAAKARKEAEKREIATAAARQKHAADRANTKLHWTQPGGSTPSSGSRAVGQTGGGMFARQPDRSKAPIWEQSGPKQGGGSMLEGGGGSRGGGNRSMLEGGPGKNKDDRNKPIWE